MKKNSTQERDFASASDRIQKFDLNKYQKVDG